MDGPTVIRSTIFGVGGDDPPRVGVGVARNGVRVRWWNGRDQVEDIIRPEAARRVAEALMDAAEEYKKTGVVSHSNF